MYMIQNIFNKLKYKKDIEAGDYISSENVQDIQEIEEEVAEKIINNNTYKNHEYNTNYIKGYNNYHMNYNRNVMSDLREIIIHKISI